jgi:LPXTG-motif cell wall-anchored protein
LWEYVCIDSWNFEFWYLGGYLAKWVGYVPSFHATKDCSTGGKKNAVIAIVGLLFLGITAFILPFILPSLFP